MPRLLAVGHVTWDLTPGGPVLGGSVSYAALCAQRLGWEAAVLTAAGADFEGSRELPSVTVFCQPGPATTRFRNTYDADGQRLQHLLARAEDIVLDPLPDAWREPDVLLIGPVAGEVSSAVAPAFSATTVGAIAQGWLRASDPEDGRVRSREWCDPRRDLLGVHVLFVSENDLPGSEDWARQRLSHVPLVALTRGWRGLTLFTRAEAVEVPSLPTPEVDPTGAGDVFAAAFLVRYHETGHPLEAAAFAACAASCVVEGPGTTSLGDRHEIDRRLARRERWLEEGEWDE
jgi:sugar/nucleoside kinase (ribokinase family)